MGSAMDYATITASDAMAADREVNYLTDDADPSARIEYLNHSNGYPVTLSCRHCGEDVTDPDDDGEWIDENGGRSCGDNGAGDPPGHEVDADDLRHPSTWLNSARVSVSGDEVHLAVSVGDPRGAFVVTVWKDRDGHLRLSVPDPSDTMPHMPLTAVEGRPGQFRIGA